MEHWSGPLRAVATWACRRDGAALKMGLMRITAAVLPETSARIEVRDVELAAPHAGEVLVRLHASGVCHSDLNAIDGTSATRCPAVLGHEGAGVVEAVGAGVEIRPGTHVALAGMPRLSWDGRPVYHYSYLSTFAEAAVVPERCVIPIPDSVSFEVAALVG